MGLAQGKKGLFLAAILTLKNYSESKTVGF
jgi:hypothetical protein